MLLVAAEVERRHVLSPPPRRARGPAAFRLCGGHRRRRHRRRGRPRSDVVTLGHGRDELRRLPRRRRRGSTPDRLRARVRLPGRRAGHRAATIGAGGGSIAWVDPGGFLQVGPAERRRRPGPRLLRPGRRGADGHRREPRARPAGPGVLPRRATCRSILELARQALGASASGSGLGRDETASPWSSWQREHGERDPADDRRAGARSARVRAGRLRRGRADARVRHRRRPWACAGVVVPPPPGSARLSAALAAESASTGGWTRFYRSDRAGRAQPTGGSLAELDGRGGRELRRRRAGGEPDSPPVLGMRYPGRTTSRRSPPPAGDDRRRPPGSGALNAIHALLPGVLRLPLSDGTIELIHFNVRLPSAVRP